MHEHALVSSLLNKLEQLALEHRPGTIRKVEVRLGALAHLSASHLREHFEHGVKGTAVKQASLVIHVEEDPNSPHAQDILLESVEVELPE